MKKALKFILIGLDFAVIIAALVLLWFTDIGVKGLNNGGNGMFDTMFCTDANRIYGIMGFMGKAGIKHHLIMHIIDYVLIMAYFIGMIIVAMPFLKGQMQLAAVGLPALVVFADLAENITMDVALLKYPTRMEGLVTASGICGWIKFALLALWVIFLVLVIVKFCLDKKKKAA